MSCVSFTLAISAWTGEFATPDLYDYEAKCKAVRTFQCRGQASRYVLIAVGDDLHLGAWNQVSAYVRAHPTNTRVLLLLRVDSARKCVEVSQLSAAALDLPLHQIDDSDESPSVAAEDSAEGATLEEVPEPKEIVAQSLPPSFWVVLQSLPQYALREGDTIRLGKCTTVVRKLQLEEFDSCDAARCIQDLPPASHRSSNAPEAALITERCVEDAECVGSEGFGPMCRICLTGPASEQLITPCVCRGSLQWVHLSCLRQWLKNRLQESGSGSEIRSFIWHNSACELCQSMYTDYVQIRHRELHELSDTLPGADAVPWRTPVSQLDRLVTPAKCTIHNLDIRDPACPIAELVDMPRVQPPFVVFQRVDDAKQNAAGGYHVLALNRIDGEAVTVGRAHNVNLRICDISVSRVHLRLTLVHGKVATKTPSGPQIEFASAATQGARVLVEDVKSKFGTLLLLDERKIQVYHKQTLKLQLGRRVFAVTVKEGRQQPRWKIGFCRPSGALAVRHQPPLPQGVAPNFYSDDLMTTPVLSDTASVSLPDTTFLFGGRLNGEGDCTDSLYRLRGERGLELISVAGAYRPAPSCNAAMAPVGRTGFVAIGGFDKTGGHKDRVMYFDTQRSMWLAATNRNPLQRPLELRDPVAATDGSGTIFVVNEDAAIWQIDFSTRAATLSGTVNFEWTLLFRPTISLGRERLRQHVTLWRDTLIVLPENTSGRCTFEQFNLTTQQMVYGPTVLCDRSSAIYFAAGNGLYRLGGCNLGGEYNCATDLSWISIVDVLAQPTAVLQWNKVPDGSEAPSFFKRGLAARVQRNKFQVFGYPVTDYSPPITFSLSLPEVSGCQWPKADNDETCSLCSAEYFGDDCQLRDFVIDYSRSCSAHGVVDSGSRCVCWPGYYGAHCQFGKLDCQCVHGACDATGRCICEEGFDGDVCDTPVACPRLCCNRGICQGTQCFCNPPYVSSSCLLTMDDVLELQRNRSDTVEVTKTLLAAGTDPKYTQSLKLLQASALAALADVNPENYFVSDAQCQSKTMVSLEMPVRDQSQAANANIVQPTLFDSEVVTGQSVSAQLGYDVARLMRESQAVSDRAADIVESQSRLAAASEAAATAKWHQIVMNAAHGGHSSVLPSIQTQPIITFRFIHGAIALGLSFLFARSLYRGSI